MTRIGLVQASSRASIKANISVVNHFAASAAEAGCDVLCFPECFLTTYHPEQAAELAIASNSDYLIQISEIAIAQKLDILVGFMECNETACYITHGIFRWDGSRDFYRKTHLGKKERLFFSAGNTLDIYTLSCGLQIGIQLCVETHYPDITRTLALKGAEVIFAPHAIPRVSGDRQKIWNKYITARSYDNRVYLACCNLWDESRFGGGILITDPRGEAVEACYKDAPQLLTCEIDRELVRRYRTPGDKRASHYYPAMRRPELYL